MNDLFKLPKVSGPEVVPGLEEFQNRVEEKITEMRLALIMQDFFYPVLIVADTAVAGGVFEKEVDGSIIDKDTMSELMKDICKSPTVKAMALILDAYTLLRDIKDIDGIPDSIVGEKDTIEAITLFVYFGKEKTFLRRCPYVKRSEEEAVTSGKYWFQDLGWKDMPQTTGRFANPF
jgi:hypothetical protein